MGVGAGIAENMDRQMPNRARDTAAIKVEGREVTFHKVSLQRTYKTDEDEFKTTSSFGRDDVPVARLLLQRAWEFILETEAKSRADQAEA